MKTLVIHHSADHDGIFCREIARKFLGESADYVGWDYGNPIPDADPERDVMMLDISVDGMMNRRRLIWIDHHKTVMQKYDPYISGYRIDGVAACRLAWQWFTLHYGTGNAGGATHVDWPTKDDFVSRRVKEPYAVQLAGEYDIWDKRNPDAELFQHGLRSQDLEQLWPALLSFNGVPAVEKLLLAGEAIQYAKTKENAGIARDFAFTIDFEGLKLIAINAARYNSHLFTAAIKPEHDGCFGFNWTGTDWRFSLYGVPHKPDVDLSVIATKHGGGGHKQACGFKAKTLPFL